MTKVELPPLCSCCCTTPKMHPHSTSDAWVCPKCEVFPALLLPLPPEKQVNV